jgi:hypothetical protein
LQPRNRPAAHIVGSGNLALCLLIGLKALDRFELLVMGEFRLAVKPDAVRYGAGAVWAAGSAASAVLARPRTRAEGERV